MPSPPPSRLREAVRGAVDRGLGFLEASIRPDGAWPSRMYWNLELTGSAEEELAPFVAALGALTLAASGDPRARSLQNRSGEFIVRSMRHPGVWRYWPSLPNDLDSLSLCSQAVPWHPWVLFGMNLGCLPTAQDDRGRFRTWLAPPNEADGVDVDSVVNANVVGYLASQDRNALGEQAAAWLAGLVREGNAEGSSHYYPDPLDLYDALARARERGVPAFQDLGAALADRIRARRGPDGGYGDTLRTARALSALHILGAPPEGEALGATVERILRRQRPDGSWPEHLFWQGPLPPDPPSVGFASAMLDTASCVEALVRSIPFPADPEPGVRRERPEPGHAQASREPAHRSSSGTGVDKMKEREIVQGGTPIVCLAPRVAFQQEADSQLALSADHSGGPVPRISIEIVPDPAAEEPRPAEPAGEQGKKHD